MPCHPSGFRHCHYRLIFSPDRDERDNLRLTMGKRERLFEKSLWLHEKVSMYKWASLISEDLERLRRPLEWLYIDRKRSFPDFSNSLLVQHGVSSRMVFQGC